MWAPKGPPRKYWCDRDSTHDGCGKWVERAPRPKATALPEQPEF